MNSEEIIEELYLEAIKDCNTFDEEYQKLKQLTGEYADDIRKKYCNEMLYFISQGFTKYNFDTLLQEKSVQTYLKVVELLPENAFYFHITHSFFKKENDKVIEMLAEYLESVYIDAKGHLKKDELLVDEGIFVDSFFEPFKQAFPEFWSTLSKNLCKYPVQKGLSELCDVIGQYYICKTDEEALEVLIDFMQKYPEYILVKELIGYTYYNLKMWNNAIAYFEIIEEENIFFPLADLFFMFAYSYGKLRNREKEELYYRKALEVSSGNKLILNNLGYCLYQQKKYIEAKQILEECLQIDPGYIYLSNNYVRVLIALGRNKDAKTIIKDKSYKFSKDIIKRVEKLDNSNSRLAKSDKVPIDNIDDFTQENAVDLGIKREQFSSEKILEDELTTRIESGIEVFGKKLKIYKRKGQYGRQFIIPIGRIDILCEDDKGDLYIIELKKDSGYDDVYIQISNYLDWFEKNEISKGKKVYGIICLNNPTDKLIEQVHQDSRMKLFEYQVSYSER